MTLRALGFSFADWLSNRLPNPTAFAWGEAFADWQWRVSAADRRTVAGNLKLVQGVPVPERSPMVREVFRHFARYLVEFFTLRDVSSLRVSVIGEEHLRTACRAPRGAIALTAHLGNWEMGAILIRRMGVEVSAVALPHEDAATNRLFNRQRRRFGVDVIPLGSHAATHSLQALRRGHVLGLLGDQRFGDRGVAVSLCGRRVLLPRGPATLSVRSEAPVLPTFITREDGRWSFRLRFGPPIHPQREHSLEDSIGSVAQQYAAILGEELRRCPTQWAMFQPLESAA
jgi:KDO2-lipid IV(A) lauroyltransferase